MANIVIAPLYWNANINVTFAVARKLQKIGHRVHYTCIPDTEERIRSQGFDFVPIFSGGQEAAKDWTSRPLHLHSRYRGAHSLSGF